MATDRSRAGGNWARWALLICLMLPLACALVLYGFTHQSEIDARADTAAAARPAPVAGTMLAHAQGRSWSASMPARTVNLTFDDGPDPEWTPKVLDALARHHVKATFYVVGRHVAEHPELVRRMVAEGHEIGIHTYTHANLSEVPAWRAKLELGWTQHVIAAATGTTTRLLRLPYSSTPDSVTAAERAVIDQATADGYLVALSDQDSRDWARPGVDQIVRASLPAGGSGAVVLLHDAGGDRSQTVAALEQILAKGAATGLRFTTTAQALQLPRLQWPASPEQRWTGQALVMAQRSSDLGVIGFELVLLVIGVLTLARFAFLLLFARSHARSNRRRIRPFGTPVTEPVSIIVPAYNEALSIQASVRSLATNSSGYPVEVVVVDDGSTDSTADLAEALDLPNVRVVRQQNGGKPAALNTGIAAASHDLLVLVDGDTVFEGDTVRRLVQPFSEPGIGAVSGNTKVINRRSLLGLWQHVEYVINFNLDRRMYDVLGCMPCVPGAIGAFRREALEEVGGVSDDTLAEDTDLTMALCRAGWRVVYVDTARAWTEAPSSLRQLWRQRYRWSYGMFQAVWKHRRSVLDSGSSGRLGRYTLPYLLFFQVLLPLVSPAIDVFGVYALFFLGPWYAALAWFGFPMLQVLVGWYAFRLDREPAWPLLTLPLQQFVFRQVMYLVVVQSVVSALLGIRLRWQRMHRTGELARVSARSSAAV